MSQDSGIEWTDATWNPIAGCSIVSPGCTNCYAMKMAGRLEAMRQAKYAGLTKVVNGHRVWTGKINLDGAALQIPLKRKKPTTWFVNSMSDLFHEGVPFDFVDKVFAVMALTPQHTYQVLTKRPERMAEYLHDYATRAGWGRAAFAFTKKETVYHPGRDGVPRHAYDCDPDVSNCTYPLPNVWLGTSCEDQKRADERIPHLLSCPAAVRFLSVEPMLGPVDLKLKGDACRDWDGVSFEATSRRMLKYDARGKEIHWVIVGGESGPGARPCDVEWVRSIVGQCKAAGVPVFVKQLGARPIANYYDDEARNAVEGRGDEWPCPIGWDYRDGQPLLDCVVELPLSDPKGGTMEEWPEDLRVREMPTTSGKAAV